MPLTAEKKKYVTENMGLVNMIARRYVGFGTDFEDLIQIGAIGLIKAADNFDEEKNIKFSTYAVAKIIGEIKSYLRDTGPVKVSRTLKENRRQITKKEQILRNKLGREPTLSELAEECMMSADEIVLCMDATDVPISLDKEKDEGPSLHEKIGHCDEEKQVERIMLCQALQRLEGVDRKLIVLRFFMDKTQSQTAEILKMTQVSVSRREKKILEKLLRFMS